MTRKLSEQVGTTYMYSVGDTYTYCFASEGILFSVLRVLQEQELFTRAIVTVISMPGAGSISVRCEAGVQQGASKVLV